MTFLRRRGRDVKFLWCSHGCQKLISPLYLRFLDLSFCIYILIFVFDRVSHISRRNNGVHPPRGDVHVLHAWIRSMDTLWIVRNIFASNCHFSREKSYKLLLISNCWYISEYKHIGSSNMRIIHNMSVTQLKSKHHCHNSIYVDYNTCWWGYDTYQQLPSTTS